MNTPERRNQPSDQFHGGPRGWEVHLEAASSPGWSRPNRRGSMYRMSDDQVSGGGVHGPSWLEMMASRSVCPETVQGWIYYCDEHDTHGNADSEDEARHMASAHTAYFLDHDEGQADPCEVFIFARTYETDDAS
jgi:hypothetical protein